MRIGRFKERININTVSTSRDALGGTTNSLSAGTEIWAKVERQNITKAFQEGRTVQEDEVLFTIRNNTFTFAEPSKHTITWRSKTYRVHSYQILNEDERYIIIRAASET